MRKVVEGIVLSLTVLYVLYSCALGVPMVVETYHKLEAYHPNVNVTEQPIGPAQLEKDR